MARCRNILLAAPRLPLPLPYASGPPPPPQPQPLPLANTPPFLTISPDLLALIASFLEGGFALRTLPLVAAPFADNVGVLISQVCT